MKKSVLYFPYMRVPENEWFTRVLLYWDEVGFIVPSEYAEIPERLGDYTAELMRVNLLKPVLPKKYIHQIPRFEASFLKMINQNPVIKARKGVALRRGETSKIHIEKFSPLVFYLVDEGLAEEASYPWFEVETLTADLFMAYLASVLGNCRDLQMEPTSDHMQSLSVFMKSPEIAADSSAVIDQLRVGILENVLPAPTGRVSPQELADFKQENIELLRGFRNHVESTLIDIACINDRQLRNRKLQLFQDQIENEKAKLLAKMKKRRWPRLAFGTLGDC